MHLDLPDIPQWWGKLGNAWLPISHHSFQKQCKHPIIIQTTIIRLFESTLATYRKPLNPIWKWIKAQRYSEDFHVLFEHFSTWLLTLILTPYQFPRNMRLESLTQTDMFRTEQIIEILHHLPNLTMYKWVKPGTSCYWIQLYPQHEAQNSTQSPLVIHNLKDKIQDFLPPNACQS